ncbi:MAG: prepilin-type N-terminal cleavage/methylation domain-containing protein [Clostridia bacterium]|nr:prepilin-type N-terminal cleavage/methylation domain-containing protein [Clostridia bacterium]
MKTLRNLRKIINKRPANKKGFTLVELLICVAVLAILSIYLIEMLSVSSAFYKRQTGQADVQSRVSVVLNTVGDIFRNAKTVAVNEDETTLTINSYDSKKTSDTEEFSRTKLLYDKATKKLYIGYDCETEDKEIKFTNYFLQDGVTSLTISNGNKDTEIELTIEKNGRSYSEKIHTYVRNTDTRIGFNVEGGWVPLPTEA